MKNYNILVVDDDPNYGTMLKKMLAQFDNVDNVIYKKFPDGDNSALGYLEENANRTDLVITDYQFNNDSLIFKTGVLFAEEINRLYPHLVLAVITAYHSDNKVINELITSKKFDGFIRKESEDENLEDKIFMLFRIVDERQEAIIQKKRANANETLIPIYTEKELLSTLVRMHCIEKTIQIYKEFATNTFILSKNEDIDQLFGTAGIKKIESDFLFKIANIGGRSSEAIADFQDKKILDRIKSIKPIDNSWYLALKREKKDADISNRKDAMFFSNSKNKTKVRQILIASQYEFPNLLEHYKPVKDIKMFFGI